MMEQFGSRREREANGEDANMGLKAFQRAESDAAIKLSCFWGDKDVSQSHQIVRYSIERVAPVVSSQASEPRPEVGASEDSKLKLQALRQARQGFSAQKHSSTILLFFVQF